MDIIAILNTLGARGVERVKNQLKEDDKVVSGETLNSVRYVITKTGVEIRAQASILTLVTGRKPTKNKGDGKVQKRIKEWCKRRGIDEKFAFAITKRIHEKGIQVPNANTDGKLLERAFSGFKEEIRKLL